MPSQLSRNREEIQRGINWCLDLLKKAENRRLTHTELAYFYTALRYIELWIPDAEERPDVWERIKSWVK